MDEQGLISAVGKETMSALIEVISRALSEGEEVEVGGLGRFYTVKYPAERTEDPPGSGNIVITLPTIEPEFDAEPGFTTTVLKELSQRQAEEKRPDLQLVLPQPVPAPVEAPPPVVPERPLGRASMIGYIDLSHLKIERDVLAMVPESLARNTHSVAFALESGELHMAMTDPEDFDAIQLIRRETGLTIKPFLASKDDITAALDQYVGFQAEVQQAIEASDFALGPVDSADLERIDDDAPTAKIVFSLLKRAVKERASDIHIEPYEKKVVVRFRVDGVLQKRLELPKEAQLAVTSRLKILANLKIDEQRLPQDGRLAITLEGRSIDFRFSTIPVVNGEKIVMRILDKAAGILSLEDVGMTGRGFETLKKNSERSHGMILVTGPTGSGKTTSLYAVLGRMMSDDVNILTLEDPVEYRIESINQSQVRSEIGYTFANGLRAVVRQDPDIVMLGEIRDAETATMAVQAALTGHIVLSTLHTNDAAGSFPRLIDMGIEPFLLTSSVHTVIAQRLTRKICSDCRVLMAISSDEVEEVRAIIAKMPEVEREWWRDKPLEFSKGEGCDSCGGKGYKGRIGVFEVLDVTEPVRDLVLKRASNTAITEQAVKQGMLTMLQDGIIKALRGVTTLEEVWRVTRE